MNLVSICEMHWEKRYPAEIICHTVHILSVNIHQNWLGQNVLTDYSFCHAR